MYGENLRKARKRANLTLEDVAIKLNTTHTSISRYETGKRKIDADILKSFCIIYNVSADYILGLSNSENSQF